VPSLRTIERPVYRPVVLTYLAVRVVIATAALVKGIAGHGGFINQLTTWDGQWYLRIVYWGYPTHLHFVGGVATGTDLAFFPLLPWLIRLVSDVTWLAPSLAGLAISALSGLTATMAVTRLARHTYDNNVARRAGVAFALLPGAFVFSWIYCEGLIITLAATALFDVIERRWWRAALAGVFATLASPAALPLVLAVAVATPGALRRREWGVLAALAAPAVTFLTWVHVIGVHAHNANAWRLTEQGGWKSTPSWRYPFHILANFLFDPKRPVLTDHLLFWGFVAGAVGLWWMLRTRAPWPVLAYTVASLGLAAISQPIGPRPRFLTIAFPLAIGLAAANQGRRFLVVVTVSAIWLALMSFETLFSWAVFP
jgi:hypothetical protein